MISRTVRAAAEAEASRWGASVSFENGSKHAFLVVTPPGRKVTFSRNHKKPEYEKDWARQAVRRICKNELH